MRPGSGGGLGNSTAIPHQTRRWQPLSRRRGRPHGFWRSHCSGDSPACSRATSDCIMPAAAAKAVKTVGSTVAGNSGMKVTISHPTKCAKNTLRPYFWHRWALALFSRFALRSIFSHGSILRNCSLSGFSGLLNAPKETSGSLSLAHGIQYLTQQILSA